jgi:hypothetical protein
MKESRGIKNINYRYKCQENLNQEKKRARLYMKVVKIILD